MHLFGRGDELRTARARLREGARCLTLVGPGGVGKTTLARASFPDAPLVQLAPATDRAGVLAQVAEALGVELGGLDDVEAVHERLAGALEAVSGPLVLDNAEHVVDDVAEVVQRWLDVDLGPMVVTSRALLDLRDEEVLPLGPLEAPAGAELLRDRARAAGVDHPDLDDDDLIDELVQLLDGSPLALELAAARMAIPGPRMLLARLREHLALSSPRRDRPDRHRSLQRVVAWSWALLSPVAQQTLAALAWFQAPPMLSDVEAVLGRSALDEIDDLRRRSLVLPEAGPDGVRLRVLEVVKAFARPRHEAPEQVAERHAGWVTEALARLAQQLDGEGGGTALRRGAALLPDARSAVDETRGPTRSHLLLGLAPIAYEVLPRSELIRLVDRGLEEPDVPDPDRAALLHWRGRARLRGERPTAALDDLRPALQGTTDPEPRARILADLAAAYCLQLDHDTGLPLFEQALAALEQAGVSAPNIRREYGTELRVALRQDEGRRQVEIAREEAARLGELPTLGHCLADLAVFDAMTDLHRARALLGRALDLDAALGGRASYRLEILRRKAQVLLECAPYDEARPVALRAQDLARQQGARVDATVLSANLAVARAVAGERGPDVTAALEAALEATRARDMPYYQQTVALALASLPLLEGAPDRAIRRARALRPLLTKGDYWSDVVMAFARASRQQDPELREGVVDPLICTALAVATGGRPPADLDALIATLPPSPGLRLRLILQLAQATVAAAAAHHPPLEVDARGRWFRLDDERVDMGRRKAARHILVALARAAEAGEGPLDPDTLIAAGWPGERILPDAARMRLHTTIRTLRKLGLEGRLQTLEASYRLDPDLAVHVRDDASAWL